MCLNEPWSLKVRDELFQQAKQAVAANSSKKLSGEEVSRIEEAASNNWDKFYGIHQVLKSRFLI